jgi:hypothetical protein
MKKLLVLPFAAVVAFAACGEQEPFGPERPQFELVDEDLRISHEDATHFVFATFEHDLGGGSDGRVLSVNDTPLFPGNQNNAGSCDNGTWINPRGQRTGGNRDTPHPFCYEPGSAGMIVVLERIAAVYEEKTNKDGEITQKRLYFTNALDEDNHSVKYIGSNQAGAGQIEARAVDRATGTWVGNIFFDLATFNTTGGSNPDLFACTLLGDPNQAGCLSRTIADAQFRPRQTDGTLGDAIDLNDGFLYWIAKNIVLSDS